MQNWKWVVLWIIVAVLILSFVVCQKKTEQAKTAGEPRVTELSSAPEETTPAGKSEPAEKPVQTTAAPEKEAAPAEEKPKAAEESKAAEPAKPDEAAPAKPEEPITRDNAAAIIEMAKGGRIVIEFYPEDAPGTVDNFIKLTNKGFYDGLTFHRVIPGFVAQTGDPTGSGSGGPGYNIKSEFSSRKHLLGAVGVASTDARAPYSSGSQFYICLEPQPGLDGNYYVFGQVIEGMDVVKGIAKGDVMKKVTIVNKNSLKK